MGPIETCPECGSTSWALEDGEWLCAECRWPEEPDDLDDQPQSLCDGTCEFCECEFWYADEDDDEGERPF